MAFATLASISDLVAAHGGRSTEVTRLRLVYILSCLVALGHVPNSLSAQGTVPARGKSGSYRKVGIDAATRARIDLGLEYLYRNQLPDGSWMDHVGRKVHYNYECHLARHVGVTALAGMAFLSSGALVDQGPRRRYCVAVRKALEFIMEHADPTGFITAFGSRMYSHAFATLFLAEAYGTSIYPDAARLRETLRRAVRLIVRAQNDRGGWRYMPQSRDSDMSVTVCQVVALRAARNAGVQVPKATIDAAVKYVRDSFDERFKAFRYQVHSEYHGPSRVSFALTACGVATLYGAGKYDAHEIRDGLDYLWNKRPPVAEVRPRTTFDYYYGHYYAVQAAFQAGGAYWERWYEFIKDELSSLQAPDGSWEDLVGPNYATAMAVIILQLPNQYLPITES